MRDEYRRLKFGFVPVEWRTPQVEAAEQILISYVKSSRDFNLNSDSTSAIEVFSIATQYIGKNFNNWLVANFNNGVGARASLARYILSWVKGDVSSKAVISEVKRDLNRISFVKRQDPQIQQPIMYDTQPSKSTVATIDFSKVNDRHFFEFITVLGPELTAHFLLSLNGIRYQK